MTWVNQVAGREDPAGWANRSAAILLVVAARWHVIAAKRVIRTAPCG